MGDNLSMDKLGYNSSDEKMVQDTETKRRLNREQELEDLKVLLEMPEGVRFLRRLMEEGKVFTTTFTGNSQTFFLEGQRNLALKFFNDIIEVSPQALSKVVITKDNS